MKNNTPAPNTIEQNQNVAPPTREFSVDTQSGYPPVPDDPNLMPKSGFQYNPEDLQIAKTQFWNEWENSPIGFNRLLFPKLVGINFGSEAEKAAQKISDADAKYYQQRVENIDASRENFMNSSVPRAVADILNPTSIALGTAGAMTGGAAIGAVGGIEAGLAADATTAAAVGSRIAVGASQGVGAGLSISLGTQAVTGSTDQYIPNLEYGAFFGLFDGLLGSGLHVLRQRGEKISAAENEAARAPNAQQYTQAVNTAGNMNSLDGTEAMVTGAYKYSPQDHDTMMNETIPKYDQLIQDDKTEMLNNAQAILDGWKDPANTIDFHSASPRKILDLLSNLKEYSETDPQIQKAVQPLIDHIENNTPKVGTFSRVRKILNDDQIDSLSQDAMINRESHYEEELKSNDTTLKRNITKLNQDLINLRSSSLRSKLKTQEIKQPIPQDHGVLPPKLQGAKPRYNYGSKKINLSFDNDVAKALYIVGGKGKSKAHADYMDFLKKTGVNDIEKKSKFIRNNLKRKAGDGQTDIKLTAKVPKYEQKTTTRTIFDSKNNIEKGMDSMDQFLDRALATIDERDANINIAKAKNNPNIFQSASFMNNVKNQYDTPASPSVLPDDLNNLPYDESSDDEKLKNRVKQYNVSDKIKKDSGLTDVENEEASHDQTEKIYDFMATCLADQGVEE